MSVEILTYDALGARLNISPVAARSLARRLRLPRSLSDDGKALVSVDLAEIHHTPQPPGRRQTGNVALLTALPPAPPTPHTIMRAFNSRISVLDILAPRLLRDAAE